MTESATLEALQTLEERVDMLDDQADALMIAFLALARALDASGTLPLRKLADELRRAPAELLASDGEIQGVREQIDVLRVSLEQLQ